MQRFVSLAAVVLVAWLAAPYLEPGRDTTPPDGASGGDAAIAAAFEAQAGDVQVRGQGRVLRLLADDTRGSRHQRFLLELASGQTLLVAHNIDLAPPIDDLEVGDSVEFFGEYEYNPRGGVIHWTHHDPAGRHVGGWLRHAGRVYE
ncbi:MAG: DUF3465 domain-containing protein [Gammaproteobacteria bacterium]